MKSIVTCGMFFLLLLSCSACGSILTQTPQSLPTDTQEATISLFAMDTYVNLSAYGQKGQAALEQAQARIMELEKLWSVTDEGSEIYAANHSDGEPVAVGKDTGNLVSFALEMAQKTDGALDPTIYPVLIAWGFTTDSYQIPTQNEIDHLLELVDYEEITSTGDMLLVPQGMALDFGAVGKGYAADEIGSILRSYGVESAILDFGGNILTVGSKPDGTPWRVGVRDPDSEGTLGVLEIVNQSVVVSGGYEKYFIGEDGQQYWHILDPKTGYPARSGLVQVAIVSDDSKLCDALSTAMFVMGLEQAVEYWQSHRDFEMILLTEDDTLYMTQGLETAFTLSTDRVGQEVHLITEET